MRDTFFHFGRAPLRREGLIWLASLAWLKVGKSAGHQLAPPTDLPTIVS